MGKLKGCMLLLEEMNMELAMVAEGIREERIAQMHEELLNDNELLRQQEALSRAADLEDFSPFDTVNS